LKKKSKKISLEDAHFSLFANPDFVEPQTDRYLWAVHEGMRRLNPFGYVWQDVTAYKKHECIRGHRIKTGDVYFAEGRVGYGNTVKLCAGCMAMFLYYRDLENLPAQLFTH
jgi:hypothetical protein